MTSMRQWLMLLCIILIVSFGHEWLRLLTASLLQFDIKSVESKHDCNHIASTLHRDGIQDAITCADARENVNQWLYDRNFDQRSVDSPSIYVSVHSKNYDALRNDTVHDTTARYYETEVIRRFNYILRRAPKNSIVIDVGANVGYYTLLSVSLGHSVHAFEINPANLIRMCESLSLNKRADNGRVQLYRRGVSNVDGQLMQVVIPKNPGHIQLTSNETTMYSLVVTITLDYLAQRMGWLQLEQPCNFSIPLLKMDVAGAESLVTQGAKQLLHSGLVRNILIEFRQPQLSDEHGSLAILLSSGYRIVKDDETNNSTSSIVRLDLNETLAFFQDIEQRFERREYKWDYADLWFQLDESAR